MTMINQLDDRYVLIFQGLTRAVTCILLLLSIKLYPQLGKYFKFMTDPLVLLPNRFVLLMLL